jgi:RNA polymerase sigma-70 factor (ECF subfamily)
MSIEVVEPMTQTNTDQLSSDQQLIFRIKNGDSTAFKQLFFSYCKPLIRFAYRFTRNVDLAEDLVQDVFLKIWSNRKGLNPQLNIKSYLYVAVKNQALKQLRHQQLWNKVEEKLKYYIPKTPTPEETFDTQEIESTVMEAIEALPERCRLIFTMNRFDRLTYSEIADILDLSVKTIETQMGRALRHLRKKLNHLFQFVLICS